MEQVDRYGLATVFARFTMPKETSTDLRSDAVRLSKIMLWAVAFNTAAFNHSRFLLYCFAFVLHSLGVRSMVTIN